MKTRLLVLFVVVTLSFVWTWRVLGFLPAFEILKFAYQIYTDLEPRSKKKKWITLPSKKR